MKEHLLRAPLCVSVSMFTVHLFYARLVAKAICGTASCCTDEEEMLLTVMLMNARSLSPSQLF